MTPLELQQAALIAKLQQLVEQQAQIIEKLTFEIATLKRQQFGRSREAADRLAVQGQLFAPPQTIDVDAAAPAPVLPRTPKPQTEPRQPKREILPENLARAITVLDLPEAETLGWVKIGADVSERLAYRAGEYYVHCISRPRYANPSDPSAGVQQQALAPSVIPGGMLDESLIAEVAISKFADHLPLSRQVERAARVGVTLSVSTLSENLLSIAKIWLKPLVDALWQLLCQRSSLHVDETVLPCLPGAGSHAGQTLKTRLWTYLNDKGPPIIVFHYTETKAGSHIEQVLAHWSEAGVRYLHADAASNYEALYRQQPNLRAVNCWAHARRKFYAIATESTTRIFAHEAVEAIDALFTDERDWKDLSDTARVERRQQIAVPKLAALKERLDKKQLELAPSSATAKAISYLTKRWPNFIRYTERGDLNISNNAAERALRKAALGRKNYLFVGSKTGGEAAAIYYSLIETAKANGIEPNQWLLHALRELPKRKGSSFDDVKDLLPIQAASTP